MFILTFDIMIAKITFLVPDLLKVATHPLFVIKESVLRWSVEPAVDSSHL